ncbi:Probable ADP-ribosylglycohydrolase [Mycobacteroides abscessus subsp. massiliense]|uniref:ADP-ribosylglycohydrolase family protein n=1 Tax=Mycobacteroides abscessus TaxID=36809 RepID=UPI0009A70221|nr:ADP-ribosylglycohydrolase family protein [Mycobacteroides abscessus]MBE5502384.1 hypothetical protein [Mycobacteroides abscessus]SLH57429.1 Probable ADP-ribosylglycohydrolase [Mycobacteroides abscessus subsp. massiliense]
MTKINPTDQPSAWSNTLNGCAYGDAWGNTNEFVRYQSLTRGNPLGPDLPGKLIITDDTQMTLALARALDTADLDDQHSIQSQIVHEFVLWRNDPDNNRAPGTTCLGATAALAAGHPWTKATRPNSFGCGSVMRVSPAAFLPEDLWRPVAAWQAAATHGHPIGIAASLVAAAIIRQGARGQITPGALVDTALALCSDQMLRDGVPDWLAGHPQADTPARAATLLDKGFTALTGNLRAAQRAVDAFQLDPWHDDPCRYTGEGWNAQEALATALLCADALPHDPVDALRRATVTGGDSDSIAAIAGAIIGPLHTDPWPTEWQARLEPRYRHWITEATGYSFTNSPCPLSGSPTQ